MKGRHFLTDLDHFKVMFAIFFLSVVRLINECFQMLNVKIASASQVKYI